MKICFILDNFYPHIGGAERVFSIISQKLSVLGHRVRIVTCTNQKKEYSSEYFPGVKVFYYPWANYFDHPIPKTNDFSAHVEWADIVHTATYSVSYPALKAAQKYNKPCVISPFEILGNKWYLVEPNILKATAFYLVEKFSVVQPYNVWTAISNSTAKDIENLGIPKKKIKTTYLGIDDNIWNPTIKTKDLGSLLGFDNKSKIFLYYGRPGKPKGIFVLLDAINIIKDQIDKNIKFGLILSNKPEKERTKFINQVKKQKLENIVHIVDSVKEDKDLASYVKSAFCVIVPSITEGFGFCAAETCSIEIPIIASNAGSLPEVVSGKHLFFENKNSIDLGEKILQASKGNFCLEKKKVFSWDKTVSLLESIYNQLKTNNKEPQ
ncbi:glycosyltransferase family 4 protein [Candidatus Dojkabacteria bacterium]|nr:glycosyltransferase family 4 protein [Candidatus Dojkabacteria bacterium]